MSLLSWGLESNVYVTDHKQANSPLLNNLQAIGEELYFSSAPEPNLFKHAM